MQVVSKEYKTSMKMPLRERGFMEVSFGVVNHKLQSTATVDSSGDFAYYSNQDIFSHISKQNDYATFEEDFTKVDGSMLFLPRQSSAVTPYDTGLVGGSLVSSGNYVILIDLHELITEFKGLTITFGENYPTEFDILDSSDNVIISVTDNTLEEWKTEDVITNTSSLKIVVKEMKNTHSRCRIKKILFGYGLVYDNEEIIDSELMSYVSPVGADVPQIDFSVTLDNKNHYFDVDNPTSAINFLETGEPINIRYGYQVSDNKIEWVEGANLLCSEWESDDYVARIRAQDVFRSLDSEYYKGTYEPNGISYFDLATRVILDAGETNYYIDPRLKTLYTKNPLPRVRHKEALQMIANACRCVLSQTRDGMIEIKSNFKPNASISCNGQTEYSNVGNIINPTVAKSEYASYSENYSVVDGRMFFLPRTGTSLLDTGYVSSQQSDDDGLFMTNPVLTITQNAQCTYYGLNIEFGYAIPDTFTIKTYNNNVLVESVDFPDADNPTINKNMYIIHRFNDFDKMEIEFTKTQYPHSRIVVNNISLGDITDFEIERTDMLSSPKAIKQERIQEVVVPCYSYQNGDNQETLMTQEVTIASGDTMTVFLPDASYNLAATLNDSSSGVSIIESGSYYAKLSFSVSGTYTLKILGYRYKIMERQATVKLYEHGQQGKTQTWKNPTISDMTVAMDLANWLSEYYSSNMEYEYETRGYPEVDTNDIIYQENEFAPNKKIKVNVYRHTINFNGAFRGKVVARRQGGF